MRLHVIPARSHELPAWPAPTAPTVWSRDCGDHLEIHCALGIHEPDEATATLSGRTLDLRARRRWSWTGPGTWVGSGAAAFAHRLDVGPDYADATVTTRVEGRELVVELHPRAPESPSWWRRTWDRLTSWLDGSSG